MKPDSQISCLILESNSESYKLNIHSLLLFTSLPRQSYFVTRAGGCFMLTKEK